MVYDLVAENRAQRRKRKEILSVFMKGSLSCALDTKSSRLMPDDQVQRIFRPTCIVTQWPHEPSRGPRSQRGQPYAVW